MTTRSSAKTKAQLLAQLADLQAEVTRLRDQHDSHAQVIHSMSEGVVVQNEHGHITQVNPIAAAMLGYEPTELLGQHWHAIIPPDQWPLVHAADERRARGQSDRYELELLRKEGTRLPVLAAGSPLIDALTGRLTGTVAVFTDMTQLRQMAQAQRDGEDLYRAIFENSRAVTLLIDPVTAHIVDANPAAARFYGYSIDELRIKRISDIHVQPPERAGSLMSFNLQAEPVRFEFQHRLASGEVRDVEIHSSPIEVRGRRLLFSIVNDITDRKRAELELENSRARLKAIFDNAAVAICLVDAEGRYVQFNSRWADMLGYTAAEVTQLTNLDVTYPDDRAISRDQLLVLVRGDIDHYMLEKRYVRKDGSVFWASLSVTPIRSDTGAFEASIGLVVDIEERKQAEADLLRTNARLETQNQLLAHIVEAGQMLRLDLDLESLLQQIVDSLAHSLGFEIVVISLLDRDGKHLRPRAQRGLPASALSVIATADYDWRAFSSALFQERFRLEDCYFIPSGAFNWVTEFDGPPLVLERGPFLPADLADAWQIADVLLVPIGLHTDRMVGVIALDKPVDGRRPDRPTLQALRIFADLAAVAIDNASLHQQAIQAGQRRETLYRATHQISASIDPGQISAALHAAVAQVMPIDALVIALLTDDPTQIDLIYLYDDGGHYPPERQPLGFGLSGYVIASGQAVCDADLNDTSVARPFDLVDFGAPDLNRPLAALAVPMRLRGRVIGMISVQANVRSAYGPEEQELLEMLATYGAAAYENARLYGDVQRHAELLERRVIERTQELTRAYEQLKDLDRMKNQFVSRISHELRTPLANIKLYLSLLERGRPEKRDEYQATLQHETTRLNQLIEDLLDISRLDMGQTPVNLVNADLNRLVADLMPDRLYQAASRDLKLTYDLDRNLPMAIFDPTLLRQVLEQILNNAFNYTPSGGTIMCQTLLGVEARRTWATFSVKDSGPGIDEDEREHLFERFFRGKAARNYRVPGTGLGLAICREIINRLGGRVTVESRQGFGSTFTIWLRTVDE